MSGFLLIYVHVMGLVIGWCLCVIAHSRWLDEDREGPR